MRLIDADALKAKLKIDTNTATYSDYCNGYCDARQVDLDAIDAAQTIEPEVRHGRWVYDETIGGMKHYYCTSCKERDNGNECIADENQILWFAFCPKCGAKMHERLEEEN